MGTEWRCSDEYFSELVQKYSDMVLRLAFTYLHNMADAQDVCQDVYMKLFKQAQPFQDTEHEKAWIVRVTINACKDVMRSPWKRRFASGLDEAARFIKDEASQEVVSFVLELPKKYRIVIHLYYFENYRTSEIAGLLGKKENTIRTQLKRARELLKTKLTGGFDGE